MRSFLIRTDQGGSVVLCRLVYAARRAVTSRPHSRRLARGQPDSGTHEARITDGAFGSRHGKWGHGTTTAMERDAISIVGRSLENRAIQLLGLGELVVLLQEDGDRNGLPESQFTVDWGECSMIWRAGTLDGNEAVGRLPRGRRPSRSTRECVHRPASEIRLPWISSLQARVYRRRLSRHDGRTRICEIKAHLTTRSMEYCQEALCD